MESKKRYHFRFYIALILVFVLGGSVFYLLKDYLIEFFYAIVLAYLSYPVYIWLLDKTHERKVLSASIVLIGLFLLVLIPLMFFGGVLVNFLTGMDFNEINFVSYETAIYDFTGIQVSISQNLGQFWEFLVSDIKDIFPKVLSFTSNFILSTFIVFFLVFYMLLEKEKILKFVFIILPFSNKSSKHLVNESGKVIKAVLIGQILTAVIQGLLGMFAFFIAGVKGAFFWGIIMILLSIIPVVGAFLIWIPIGLFLLVQGDIWQGVFVLAWGGIVVSQIDNIIRPKLVQRFANIHPIETLLGVFGGITVFGIIGIVIGPLIISLFKIVAKFFFNEYSGNKNPNRFL